MVEVERKVKAVIQVAGLHYLVRPDPQNEGRRAWFREVCPPFLSLLIDSRIVYMSQQDIQY